MLMEKTLFNRVRVCCSGGEPVARVPEMALTALSVGTRTFALEFVSRKIEETRGQVAPKVGTATWNDTTNGRA